MILDAATHEQVAAVDRILARRRGAAPARAPEDGAVRLGVRDQHRCLRRRRRGRRGAARPAPCRGAAAAEQEGLAIARAGTHPFARPEAQPIVKEERYVTFVGYGGISVRRQGVQGLHVHVGMPSADDCWRCLDAIVPWLPGRARAVGELAVVRRRADGHGVEPCADPRGAAARRCAAGVRVVRGVGGVGRAARRDRRDGGLHAHLVGRAAASEARHARGARPGPADGRAALGGVRSARAGDVRDGARRAALPGGSPRADYIQNRWAAARFGPRANLIHPDGLLVPDRDRARGRAARARAPGGRTPRRSGGARASRPVALRG